VLGPGLHAITPSSLPPDGRTKLWTLKVLEGIEREAEIERIKESLHLSDHELRAAIRTLKALGLPIVRKGKRYHFVQEGEVSAPKCKDIVETMIAAKEITKVLRFIYGEEVRYLWPNKVLKEKEVLVEITEEGINHKLPHYLSGVVARRAASSLKRRRLPEVVRALNAMLYKGEILLELNDGRSVVGTPSNVDVKGRIKIGGVAYEAKDVKSVIPL